jgi:hypothetical protein
MAGFISFGYCLSFGSSPVGLIHFRLTNLILLILIDPNSIFFQLSITDFHHVYQIAILVTK